MNRPRPDPVAPGQESVREYPRPPSAEVTGRRIVVELAGHVLADTVRAIRVCETSHPPVHYVPREHLAGDLLRRAEGSSWCAWKGAATYWDAVVDGRRVPRIGWSYEEPSPGYEYLRAAVAFSPGTVDRALVDGEQARPQPGGFYGGWVTADGAGPVKGGPGSSGW